MHREAKQEHPKYDELCRRYLADEKDFSAENIEKAGIDKAFVNNADIEECLQRIITFIKNECQ